MAGFQHETLYLCSLALVFHIHFPKVLSVPSPRPRHPWAADLTCIYWWPHQSVFPGEPYTLSQWWNLQEFGGKSPELWRRLGHWEWAIPVGVLSESLQNNPLGKNRQSFLCLSGLGYAVGEGLSIQSSLLVFLVSVVLLMAWEHWVNCQVSVSQLQWVNCDKPQCFFCLWKAAWYAGRILPAVSNIPPCTNLYIALWL